MAASDETVGDASGHGPMDQFTAHIDRGWDLVHRGDLHGALVSAEKSVEIDAQAPEAHNLLGYVKAALGHADDALDHYKQALALDDTFVEAMLNAAEVLIHPLHDFDAAIGMVEEALDFAENDDEIADAVLLKYDAHMHQGDKDGAARVAARLPEGPFENPRLDFMVGRAHFEVGNHATAKRLLESAVAREPLDADALYTLGLVYEATGDAAAMVSAFLRARGVEARLPPLPWALEPAAFEARVAEAIARLPAQLRKALGDAAAIVADLPGPEVVADGVDPRICVLLDTTQRDRTSEPRVTRVFVYQRNVERLAEDPALLNDELDRAIEEELCLLFPDLARFATPRDDREEH